MKLLSVFRGLFRKQKGQGLVEYAFILILIALATLGAIGFLGSAVSDFYNYFMTLF